MREHGTNMFKSSRETYESLNTNLTYYFIRSSASLWWPTVSSSVFKHIFAISYASFEIVASSSKLSDVKSDNNWFASYPAPPLRHRTSIFEVAPPLLI